MLENEVLTGELFDFGPSNIVDYIVNIYEGYIIDLMMNIYMRNALTFYFLSLST